MTSFANLGPVAQALIATVYTCAMTGLGAAFVFMRREPNRKSLDGMLGFAAGVMAAASFWSLLEPAVQLSRGKALPLWVPPAVGFIAGSMFIYVLDQVLPHLHLGLPVEKAEGIRTRLKTSALLVLAITLHNIPEGLSIGVAFGAASAGLPGYVFPGALALAIGIGIQDIPEGIAVSMPLRAEGMSRRKSFWYGQISGIVEPLAAVVGALAVTRAQGLLPYALAFAAGAMVYVVVEEVIPESRRFGHTDLATLTTLGGFVVMMILDVAFS
jgi:zinc transporter, ZIP family